MTDVVTGEAVILEVPCARYPSRMVALLIDMVVQVVTVVILFVVVSASGAHLNPATIAAIGVAVVAVIIVGYPAAAETLFRGRSLGKLALGLRVVSDDGGPERFRQALVRALASVVEIWLLAGAPALICSLLSSQGKRLGDVFAGTFVIQERLPRRPALPAALTMVPVALTEWAAHLELSGLTDQAADATSNYLRRYGELAPAARDELGRRIAATIAAQVTSSPPAGTTAPDFLVAVLAVRREREAGRLAADRQRWQAQSGTAPGADSPPRYSPPMSSPPAYSPPGDSPPRDVPPADWIPPGSTAGAAAGDPDAPDSGQFAPPV